MQCGSRYEVKIEDLGQSGEGVCRVEGLTVFVPGAVLGERVAIELTELKRNYGLAKIISRLEASPWQVASRCPDYPECGGCQLLDLDYTAQLVWKQRQLESALQRIGKLQVAVEPIIGMTEPWHYRNKMSYPVNPNEIGMYRQGSHDIVSIQDCQVHPPIVGEILTIVRRHLGRTISGYDEARHKGSLRQVMIRYSFDLDQLMVVLVTHEPSDLTPLIDDLKQLPAVQTIIENKNNRRGNTILCPHNVVHYGLGVIEEALEDLRFEINPHAFYQINTVQLKRMYDIVREWADLSGVELVYDIYAGLGTIGSYLSPKAKQVLCIEVVPQAVEAGIQAAKNNGLENVDFVLGKAEEVMLELQAAGQKPDLVVVDPPRKGLDPVVVESLLSIQPERIIYVSCKPSTLARDLKLFVEGGYGIKKIQPIDLFPHTTHVETVVLMSRTEK